MTLAVFIMPGETESIVEFPGWRDPEFIGLYICTSFMGECAREAEIGRLILFARWLHTASTC